jgi:L-lactate dehydrogenase complex protein LldG
MIQAVEHLVAAFTERAGRLNVPVHAVESAAIAETALGIAGQIGATSVAVASGVPDRERVVVAATEAGLRVVPPDELWIDRRAELGVSRAQMAVAETGSLVIHASSVDRRVELCVDVLAVVVDLDNLRPTMDDAIRLVREIAARPPSYVSFVTGPSRTADIEMVPSIGVHGAREIHVLLVRGS